MKKHICAIAEIFLLLQTFCTATDVHTRLMHYTFKTEGPSSKGPGNTIGTVFFMGIMTNGAAGKAEAVLVTAAHVLEGIKGEEATLHFRIRKGEGLYRKTSRKVTIRTKKTPLYTRHPKADVAVMKTGLPPIHVQGLGTPLLANDKLLTRFEIHPGDELFCLGYPFGAESNAAGFPILRSGRLASYPLIPSQLVGSWLFDFEVFDGNSGGPVYFHQSGRTYAGSLHADTIQFVAGLLSKQKYQMQQTVRKTQESRNKTKIEIEQEKFRLGLGVVVPAFFIRETIEMLEDKK